MFSYLKQNDRYKSSVFIDTFCTRLGDLSGSLFISLGNLIGVGFSLIPLFAIPITGIFSYFGLKIAKETKIERPLCPSIDFLVVLIFVIIDSET